MAGLTFIHAAMPGIDAATLRVVGARIVAVGGRPEKGDRVIDLRGDRLLPGLINAHDHLQLNSLPPVPSDSDYPNVRNWIETITVLRTSDAAFMSGVAVVREKRLDVGGIKNLLSGVTTVAHHDPLYPHLLGPEFPTRVVSSYGWSHSLYIDGAEKVRSSYRETPSAHPWIIHAAEGVDAEAQSEFGRLDALGCIGANTLLVHGVALEDGDRLRIKNASAGLIWCPSSNLRLFGKTAAVVDLIDAGRVALGTDSRLSGSRDLLEELRIARDAGHLDERTLESLVTDVSARLLRLSDRGRLRIGALADLLVLPAGMPTSRATRANVRLVMRDGKMRYGDSDYAELCAPFDDWRELRVDGACKVLQASLAKLLIADAFGEPGLELLALEGRAA